MPYLSYYSPSFIEIPKGPIAIKGLCLWFGFLAFFFSPEIVHAEYLDRLELVNHLRQGHYSQLEKILAHQEILYQKNTIPEEHVEAAYWAFANSAADLKEKLNEWVQQPSKSGTAHLARGMYYWNIGWKARGSNYMSATPTARAQGMKSYFSLAWQDLKEAAQKKGNSGIPYMFLISIAMNFSDELAIEQFLKQGLQDDPRSKGVRWRYLNSLRPWWSGMSNEQSITTAQGFIDTQVSPFIKNMPNLKSLLGYPDYLQARILDRNGQGVDALAFYEEALQHGSDYWFRFQWAKTLFYLDRDNEALDIIDLALQERPQVPTVLHYRARILEALNQPEAALQQETKVIQLDELDSDRLQLYAWRLKRQGRIEEAKEILTQALIYGSHDHGILGDLGRLYLADLHDPTEALPYLKKAVELKPARAWHWLNYGWALNKLGQCKAVGILESYKFRCLASGNCSSNDLEWAKKTSQRMIWKEGCWREHPTLKILKHLAKWLPEL